MKRVFWVSLFVLIALGSSGQIVLSELPDQTIGRSADFDTIDLSDFVSSDDVFWEIAFLDPNIDDARPAWEVDPSKFQFEMNLTAVVNSKGIETAGDDHLLALIDATGEVRGVSSPQQIGESWVYFMTVYGQENAEVLSFHFFDDSIQQLLGGTQELEFVSNGVVGLPDDPYAVDVGIIEFDLQGSMLNLEIIDTNFFGEENLVISARNLNNPIDLDTDTLKLVIDQNYTPGWVNIPDQIAGFDEQFQSFDLDDFTLLRDADEVVFAVEGFTELAITIDAENIVTIEAPEEWSGSENITFTVVDVTELAFSSRQVVTFGKRGEDQAPVILDIPNQLTGNSGFFAPIDLSQFVEATNLESIEWHISFVTEGTETDPEWEVNPSDFQFNMNMTAQVVSLGVELTGSAHRLAAFSATNDRLIGVAEPLLVGTDWYFFLTIYSDSDNESVYFKVFDANSHRVLNTNQSLDFTSNEVIGDPLEPYRIDAGNIFLDLEGVVLNITVGMNPWQGTEELEFIATDVSTSELLFDKDTASFTVLNITSPQFDDIPTQHISEGESFMDLNLMEYLTDATFDEITFQIAGADTLNPVLSDSIVSFNITNLDYFGTEKLEATVTSNINPDLKDVVEINLEVQNVNDPPQITTSPEQQVISIKDVYFYRLEMFDIDVDELEIDVSKIPDWLFHVPTEEGAIFVGIPTEEDVGIYTIEVSVSDGQQVVQQAIVIDVLEFVLSIPASEKVIIIPNPASDFIKLENLHSKMEYGIYSMSGNQIRRGEISDGGFIDVRRLESGAYLLQINGNVTRFLKL